MSKHTLDQLVDELSALTVLEMAELKTKLEDKWGVKASAGVAMVAGPAAAAPAAEAEAQEFSVTLEPVDADKKVAAIKIVREITGLGLKEAKELVEAAPKAIKEQLNKADSQALVKKFEDVQIKVTVKAM
ncbi:MAG: 50S ribosomal protein L7/L12 [Chlamydiia bacterium]